ncbi:MAG: KdsC family phosphatase [Planctomycetota bacterium]|jgi:3-deoxy-D-manno-octulosonate 8-phosphate phosphatase (KDO 8-P phosphatase)
MSRHDPTRIRLLCLDVDGVLTDGSVLIDDAGVETKRFFVRDGTAIRMWQRQGGMIAIITGRRGEALRHRARELGIDNLVEGVERKGEAFAELLESLGVDAAETAMVGDDLPDLPILERCGYPVAVRDAAVEVIEAACHVTTATGGRGAVREVVELLLKAKGDWEDSVERYRERG